MVVPPRHPGGNRALSGAFIWATHTGILLLLCALPMGSSPQQTDAVHEGLHCCGDAQRVLLPPKTPLTWNIIYRRRNTAHSPASASEHPKCSPPIRAAFTAVNRTCSPRCAWPARSVAGNFTHRLTRGWLSTLRADHCRAINISPLGQSTRQGLKEKKHSEAVQTHTRMHPIVQGWPGSATGEGLAPPMEPGSAPSPQGLVYLPNTKLFS